MIFFDKNGMAWSTCHPNHPAAQLFGPGWTSRPLDAQEINFLGLNGNHLPLIIAQEKCGVVKQGEFWIMK